MGRARSDRSWLFYTKAAAAAVLLLALCQGCILPIGRILGVDQQPPGAPNRTVEWAVKGSQTAEAARDQPGEKEGEGEGQDPSPTASLTPSFTPSLTPTITLTPTPYADISQNTNCRFGPGTVYDLIQIYLAGDQVLLLGKDAGGLFYYTRDTGQGTIYCWLWGKYATPVGNTAALPVFTPPPTPTPKVSFSVAFAQPDCGAGSCWLWLKVTNTGNADLESVRVYAVNTVTSAESTNTSNEFKDSIAGSNIPKAAPGDVVYTHTAQLPNPSGQKVKIEVTACSQDNLNGHCAVQSFTVTP